MEVARIRPHSAPPPAHGRVFESRSVSATVVMLTDFVPRWLVGQPADVDIMVQREGAPSHVLAHTGSGVNAGFVYVRGATSRKRDALVTFLSTSVLRRGLVEFYHRWNNVVDHFGYTHLFKNDLTVPTDRRPTRSPSST